MNRPRPAACPRTDAVLALYLDGDVAGADHSLEGSGFELVCGDSLRDHLLGCGTCRDQLLRARRLDAVLAARSGSDVGSRDVGALARRWFAAIGTAPPAAPTTPAHARRAAARMLILLPLLTAGLAFALGSTDALGHTEPASPLPPGPEPVAPVEPGRPPTAPAPTTSPPAATGPAILIAGDAPSRRARHRATPAAPTTARDDLARLCADPSRTVAARLEAVGLLAAAASGGRSENPQPLNDLLLALAGLGDRDEHERTLHRRALERVRGDGHLVGALQACLQRLEAHRGGMERPDLAALTVAARLGGRSLDAAIQRAVRRHPELATTLAAALRDPVRSTGSATLLLDIWQDLAARSGVAADEAGPRRWFQGQPTSVFVELERVLQTTCSAPRRVQCLLALGEGTDAASLATLVEQVQRAPFCEAHAAAFALSHRPRRQLEALLQPARAADQFLLRAALARAAVPAAAPWVAALALDDADRAALACGPVGDFPRVANWFRDRSLTCGD